MFSVYFSGASLLLLIKEMSVRTWIDWGFFVPVIILLYLRWKQWISKT